ncbi:DUF3108 domain-containing protein [Myxococcota bacterium]|nr:DUF3108 domain-containing protein [Myxococcota bacterium]
MHPTRRSFERPDLRARWGFVALFVAASPLVSGDAHAEPARPAPQRPTPEARAVKPRLSLLEKKQLLEQRQAKRAAAKTEAPKPARCDGITLPTRPGALPFAPGEELAYEISVAGLSVGRFETKVGKPRTVDGKSVISLFGRARTNSILATFQRFEGRYMTLVDPATMRPIGLKVESTYGDDPRWERARFTDGDKKLAASFLMQGRESERSYARDVPLTDVLTMLYFARTRAIPGQVKACQEVFGQRWLWRMEAEIAGTERVDTPVGPKDATVVRTSFVRSEHPDLSAAGRKQRIEMDVFLAKDASQAPLAFTIRTEKITADVKLVRWSLKASDDDTWEL